MPNELLKSASSRLYRALERGEVSLDDLPSDLRRNVTDGGRATVEDIRAAAHPAKNILKEQHPGAIARWQGRPRIGRDGLLYPVDLPGAAGADHGMPYAPYRGGSPHDEGMYKARAAFEDRKRALKGNYHSETVVAKPGVLTKYKVPLAVAGTAAALAGAAALYRYARKKEASDASLKERFESKITREGGKARWTGSTNNIGYPKMKVDGEMVLGSHVALRLAGRKVPTGGPAGGKIVMHKDNDKLNLAPSNLQVGTHKANLKQMRDEGRDRPRGVHQEPDVKVAVSSAWVRDRVRAAVEKGVPQERLQGFSRKMLDGVMLSKSRRVSGLHQGAMEAANVPLAKSLMRRGFTTGTQGAQPPLRDVLADPKLFREKLNDPNYVFEFGPLSAPAFAHKAPPPPPTPPVPQAATVPVAQASGSALPYVVGGGLLAAGGGALALHHHLRKKEVDGEKVARVHRAVKQLRRAVELVGDGSVAYHAGSAEGVANSARMRELVPGARQAYGKGVYFQVGSPNQKYGPAAVALRGEKADNLLRQLPREDALPSAWRISPDVVPLGGKDVLVSHGEHPDGALGRAVVRSGARDGRLRHIDAAPWQQAVAGSTDSRAAVDAAKRTRRADIAADKSVAEARRVEALRYKKLVEESDARWRHTIAASPPAAQAKTASTDIDILKYAFQGETTSDGPGVASRAAAPAVALGLSGAALAGSGDSVLRAAGYQRIHHGTSRDAAKSIREHGLDPAFGGGPTGSSAAVNNERFIRESTGKVHVSNSKVLAGMFSRLAQAHADSKATGQGIPLHEAQGIMVNPFRPKGEVLTGAMPFTQFRSDFEVDPDAPLAFRSTKKVDPQVFRTGALDAVRAVAKSPGALGKYIKKHPARFASGVGGVLLPAAAVAGSGAWLADRVGDKVAFKLQGHTKHQGIPIAIENRKGSVRKGVDKDGKPWRTVMKMPYGYIKGSKGADGEEIDCYVGPDKDAPNAYVVHQRKADGTGYDEDKVLLGMKDKEEAKKKYLQHYNSDKFLGPVKEVPVERLKEMLSEGKKLEKISRLCGRLFRRG